MRLVHEISPDTHAELNVNYEPYVLQLKYGSCLLFIYCIVLAHISMDCIYCLDVHQCDVLHYSRDTEVVHLKHQKNDKQP